MKTIGITEFVKRQLDEKYIGTRLTEQQLSELRTISETKLNLDKDVKEGYAEFCKEVYIEDYPITCPVAEITEENEHLLKSGYARRKEDDDKELPYLSRSFPKGTVEPTPAHHVTVIIYTKEQMQSEGDDFTGSDFDIVCVMAEPDEKTAPMNPYTMVRNHLGKEFGGSGAKIDVEKYMESVEYWSTHALVDTK